MKCVSILAAEAETRELSLPASATSCSIRIPTLNNKGSMITRECEQFTEFIKVATLPNSRVLEIGSAFGFVALKALSKGASDYTANDACEDHLRILAKSVMDTYPDRHDNVHLLPGRFPEVATLLASESYDAILAANILQFLTNDELVEAFSQFRRLLKPGGKLFLSMLTAFADFLPKEFLISFNANVVPIKNLEDFQNYPGFIPSLKAIDSALTDDSFFAFNIDVTKFLLKREHFAVDYCDYDWTKSMRPWKTDGRETLIAVAKKEQ
uniref:Methyltransferase domain-containing protein n=2 Tax=Plectus sambesii TaxID=2011161 RepID=A0A914V5V4_9BILA